MRGCPSDEFLVEALRSVAMFMKSERRPTAAKWCRLSAARLKSLSAELRVERAKAEFLDVLTAETPRKDGK